MEIDPINSVKKIHNTEKINNTKKVSNRKKEVDSVNISPEAREAAENARLVEMVKNSDFNRADKIAELKKKINDEAYLSEVIGDKLVENIAEKILGVSFNS